MPQNSLISTAEYIKYYRGIHGGVYLVSYRVLLVTRRSLSVAKAGNGNHLRCGTESKPWHDVNVVPLEKILDDSGGVDAGIVLLEYVMLVTAKIGHNVKSKDSIDIPQSRDAITST